MKEYFHEWIRFPELSENSWKNEVKLPVTLLIIPTDVNLKHGINLILGSDFLYKCRTKICYEDLNLSFPISVANLENQELASQAHVPFHAFLPKTEQLEIHVVINPEGIPEFVWDPIEKEAPTAPGPLRKSEKKEESETVQVKCEDGIRFLIWNNGIKLTVGASKEELSDEDLLEVSKEFRISFNLFDGWTEYINGGSVIDYQFPIELTNDKPIRRKLKHWSPEERKIIETWLQKMLEAGFIRPSLSPFATNLVLVLKPDGSPRICVDFTTINARKVRDAYPLPKIDVYHFVKGSHWISIFDCLNGFHALPIRDEDCHKTAFITPFGLFEFTRMAFGLCNAPSGYQRNLDKTLAEILWETVCAYIDDVTVKTEFAKEKSERQLARQHVQDVNRVFHLLHKNRYLLAMKKSILFSKKVILLGALVSGDCISPNPKKEEMLKLCSHRRCKSLKDVQSILGRISWFRHFIPGFAQLMSPLYHLTRANAKFEWTQQHIEVIDKAVEFILKAQKQVHHDPTLEKLIHIDYDEIGYAAKLMQQNKENPKLWELLLFESKSWKGSALNYSAEEKIAQAFADLCMRHRNIVHSCPKIIVKVPVPYFQSICSSDFVSARLQRLRIAWGNLPVSFCSLSAAERLCSPSRTSCHQHRPAGIVTEEENEIFVRAPTVFIDGASHLQERTAGSGIYWGEGSNLNRAIRLPNASTNQEAELSAAIHALQIALGEGLPAIVVSTDSAYVVQCMEEHIRNWKINDEEQTCYRNAGKALKNGKLFYQLSRLASRIKVRWEHVKGHSGIEGNEKAHLLAQEACSLTDEGDEGLGLMELTAEEDEWENLPETAVVGIPVAAGSLWEPPESLYERIIRGQREDPFCNSLVDEGPPPDYVVTTSSKHFFKDENGVWKVSYANRRALIIPEARVNEVLRVCHDSNSFGGHLGGDKTIQRIKQCMFWKHLSRDVTEFVKGCVICHQLRPLARGVLTPYSVPTKVWDTLHIDSTPILKSRAGQGALYVLQDKFSKFLMTSSFNGAASARSSIEFMRIAFSLFGYPREIISDNGSEFDNIYVKRFLFESNVKWVPVASYNPQANGQAEGAIKHVKMQLRKRSTNGVIPFDWPRYLPAITHVHNTAVHRSTGMTPFDLMFVRTGRSLIDPPELPDMAEEGTLEVRKRVQHRQRQFAIANLSEARGQMIKYSARRFKPKTLTVSEWSEQCVVPSAPM